MTTHVPHKTGCLVCGESVVYSRGLCQKHYRQFKAEYDAFTQPEKAKAFEDAAIKGGWLLPKQFGGRPKSWSPFAELSQELRAKSEDKIVLAGQMPVPELIGPENPSDFKRARPKPKPTVAKPQDAEKKKANRKRKQA